MAVYEKPTISLQSRITVASAVVIVIFLFLGVRLWYLQIIHGEYFRERSENNRQKTVFIPAARGAITDRAGQVLARSRPAFQIELTSEETTDLEGTIALLSELVNKPAAELSENLRKGARARRRYEPNVVLRDIDRDTVARVSAARPYLPGVAITAVPARDYPYGDLAAHVLGYMREISQKQLRSPRFSSGYQSGDLVGQYGIESRFENYLQGKRGRQSVIVNVRGVRVRELPVYDSEIPGHTVTLTLDLDVQKAADEALGEQRGAVVAMSPNTGEIYALASSPKFNPEIFVGEVTPDQWHELNAGRDRPLNNRAVQGLYPPGSIFKVIMAVAGLAEGVISPKDTVFCPGYYTFGGRRYACHKQGGHGRVNLESALVASCDVYFYELGRQLGVDRIHEYSARFGLGSQTGVNLVYEPEGLVPSTEWKRKYFQGTEQARWFPGETLSVAIGQGAIQVTPLQMAVAFSALVNGGKVLRPQLVSSIVSPNGSFRDEDFGPEVLATVDVPESVLHTITKDLAGVVSSIHGTAHRAALPKELNISVAGKTGTAQVVALSNLTKDHYLNHHAWFVGFAPADKPEIVVATLIENGGHGGAVAAPVTEQVMEAYFRKKLGLQEKSTTPRDESGRAADGEAQHAD